MGMPSAGSEMGIPSAGSERWSQHWLELGRQVIAQECQALAQAAERLDGGFVRVVAGLWRCSGRVAVVGVGKSADVGQKITGTFNSTGTRSYTLDPIRAVHGDLGMVAPEDVALLLSHSGESEELVRLLPALRQRTAGMYAITSHGSSRLAQAVDAAVLYGPLAEACPLGLAPSSSTTVMLAIGDALAFVLMEQRRFTEDDFARNHPAGSLGRRLARVTDYMRRDKELRLAPASATVRQVFTQARHHGRRTGAIMLLDDQGRLAGLFTDSDLARLFESRRDEALDRPIAEVMTRQPIVVRPQTRLAEAIDLLRSHKISELPVVDDQGRPLGMLDITDLIGMEQEAIAAEPVPLRILGQRKSA
ncbi:KpsF/GutQ family sugar-phosphate isomerase [Thermogemmata fonticola]|jgi:arabinose-5-phosphate isomerase|nr:KpsF/GutQ family sugar-phosphate isomerase [Thermogemmata fonticola]